MPWPTRTSQCPLATLNKSWSPEMLIIKPARTLQFERALQFGAEEERRGRSWHPVESAQPIGRDRITLSKHAATRRIRRGRLAMSSCETSPDDADDGKRCLPGANPV